MSARRGRPDVASLALASQGQAKIDWAADAMPVLGAIRARFAAARPLRGLRVACCLHVTAETANLVLALKAGGAEVRLCASNPLSTQDDVAAALVRHSRIAVFAVRGEPRARYYAHLRAALGHGPQVVMDDGADLTSLLHRSPRSLVTGFLGGTEETTTGVVRLRSLAERGLLLFPVIDVNHAETKHFFDNRYGTGQSSLDGILRATNRLIAGSTFVVCGYGWCGRGVALRARGMGAHVVVTEVDPVKALEAVMDGYQVLPMQAAARVGDIFVTATGSLHVVREPHLRAMKDGAIVANAGHFDVEVDLRALRRLSRAVRRVRPSVQGFTLRSGRRIFLLAEGRLVNLGAAEGHPAGVMDMSFSNQALSVEYLREQGPHLERQVYRVPAELDRLVARLKLKSLGVHIDALTREQQVYLRSWEVGT